MIEVKSIQKNGVGYLLACLHHWLVGLLLIMLGMVLHSFVSGRKEKEASPVNVSG
ncbi:hypothetical protein P4U85_22650 [Brevibacillus laterosporus]|nr:hypothetical protein [Brevibacillus laterosporus]MED1670145.1 hypothetical protein [Brevibacillus laterosporus]MED1718906.1 hypothetical protein [Brevibacillus laterosporus]